MFTSESRQEILGKAGTGHWVINPKNANRCRYVVCCRKANWKNRADGIAQRAAFLVGRIAGLDADRCEQQCAGAGAVSDRDFGLC
ncbi:hypothetical protein [Bradyrhizobium sp. USDA 4513]